MVKSVQHKTTKTIMNNNIGTNSLEAFYNAVRRDGEDIKYAFSSAPLYLMFSCSSLFIPTDRQPRDAVRKFADKVAVKLAQGGSISRI